MKKIVMLTLGILIFSGWIYAQAPAEVPVYKELPADIPLNPSIPHPDEAYSGEVISSDLIQGKIYDPAPIVVKYSPDAFEGLTANALRGSFSQEAAWNLRNNFGFSLGANEGYYVNDYPVENSDSASDGKSSASATMFTARAFTNYAKGKSTMHLDYGVGFSYYPERRNSADNINHDINAAYVYRISAKSRFQIQDHLSSSANDPLGDIFSLNSSYGRLYSGSSYYDLMFAPQRYIRNTVNASFNTDVTGKGTNVRFFGSYDNYWYGEHYSEINIEDYYSATVGVGVNQRIKKRLSLGGTYSMQLNDGLRDYRIHRVDGNIQFALSQNVQIYASSGIAFTEYDTTDEGFLSRVMASAGISYSTEARSLYANYSRTMMSVGGSRRLLPSDTFTVGLGQPITEKLNLRLTAYYQRSSDYYYSGQLSAYQGQASAEYLLAPGLFASVSYSRRHQDNSISSQDSLDSVSNIPYFERSTISAGLQYSWPTRRSGR